MFFIPQVLGRKGPLATVWLAAHLDRRITRRQIEETDLVQVISILLTSEAKFSLRIMGDLVVGVATLLHRQVKNSINEAEQLEKAVMVIAVPKSTTRIDLPPNRQKADPSTISLPELPPILDIDYLESLLPRTLPPQPTVPRHTITLPEAPALPHRESIDRLIDDDQANNQLPVINDFEPTTFEEFFGEAFPGAAEETKKKERVPFKIPALDQPNERDDEVPPIPPLDQLLPPGEEDSMIIPDISLPGARDMSKRSGNFDFSLPPLDESAIRDERRARGQNRGRRARARGRGRGRRGQRGRQRNPSPDALPDWVIRAQQAHRWHDHHLPDIILPSPSFRNVSLEEPYRKLPGELRHLFPRLDQVIWREEDEEEEIEFEPEVVGGGEVEMEEEQFNLDPSLIQPEVDPTLDESTLHPIPPLEDQFEMQDIPIEPEPEVVETEKIPDDDEMDVSVHHPRYVHDENEEGLLLEEEFEINFRGTLGEALRKSDVIEFESIVPERESKVKSFMALLRTAHQNPSIRVVQEECSVEELLGEVFKPIKVMRSDLNSPQEVISHQSVEI